MARLAEVFEGRVGTDVDWTTDAPADVDLLKRDALAEVLAGRITETRQLALVLRSAFVPRECGGRLARVAHRVVSHGGAGMFAWEADKPELARQSQIHYLSRVAQRLGVDNGAFGHPLSREKRGRKSGKWTELPRLLEAYAPELVAEFTATLALRTASLVSERPRMYTFGIDEFDGLRTAVQQSHGADQLERANQLKTDLAQSADEIRRAWTELANYIRTTFPLA